MISYLQCVLSDLENIEDANLAFIARRYGKGQTFLSISRIH